MDVEDTKNSKSSSGSISSSYDEKNLENFLRIYYQRLFPFKEMYQWLSYGNVKKDYFLNREWSFTLIGDVYMRFKSFPDVESWSKEVNKYMPIKMDIGAVYSLPPRDKANFEPALFVPNEKELVFDVDLTDYDEIRTCCQGANICNKCWKWASIAIQVVDKILTNDFGFKHLLWIYSGRRGVHCWVADSRARRLSAEARDAIISYISVIVGGEKSRKVQLGAKLHPTLKEIYDEILEPYFTKYILDEQKLLDSEESEKIFINSIPNEALRKKFFEDWKGNSYAPDVKWSSFVKSVTRAIEEKKITDINPIIDMIFTYTYPRLDVKVSTGVNHLLKSPFCVHPKTGRICVPIDPKNCREFDPSTVPQVSTLLDELNAYDKKHEDKTKEKKLKDFKKTQMGDFVAQFKTQFLRPLQHSIKDEQVQEQQRLLDETSSDQTASSMAF